MASLASAPQWGMSWWGSEHLVKMITIQRLTYSAHSQNRLDPQTGLPSC